MPLVISTSSPVDQMPSEANGLCTCKANDHLLGPCANRATANDGLCDGCRAAQELSVELQPQSGFLRRLQKLFAKS